MASRRRARECALQALYQADVAGVAPTMSLNGLLQGQLDDTELAGSRPADSQEVEFAGLLVAGVESNMEMIDPLIESVSKNWRLNRMPVVDRSILRLAAFELACAKEVPVSVIINEAVELAKKFGERESKSFVNGLLDRIAVETGRGGRGGNTKKRKK